MKRLRLLILLLMVLPAMRAGATDICSDTCSTRPTEGVLSCSRKCNAFQNVELPTGFEFLPKFLAERSEPPTVKTVTIDPERPAAGSPVSISVKMFRNNAIEKAQSFEFEMYTTTEDLFHWQRIPMLYDPIGESWGAQLTDIPATPTMYFFLRGFNDANDAYVEIPCSKISFPFKEDDCTVPLTEDETYEETEDFHVDPAFDLTTSRVGADNEYLYFSLDTVAPLKSGRRGNYMNMYFVAVNNLDRTNKVDPLSSITYIVYAPAYFTPADCKAVFFLGGQWLTDSGPVACIVRDKTLFFRVRRGVLGKMPNSTFSVFRGVTTMLAEDMSVIQDYSPVSVVHIGPRRIDFTMGGNPQTK